MRRSLLRGSCDEEYFASAQQVTNGGASVIRVSAYEAEPSLLLSLVLILFPFGGQKNAYRAL
jgi:hypothetical protein